MNNQIYTERERCIFCNSGNLYSLWNDDKYSIPLGCYVVENLDKKTYRMPFNVQKCKDCLIYQTKFIGNVNIIYDYNAKSHGSIRNNMDILFSKFIVDNDDIKNIAEIGGGNGSLSDIIMDTNSKINYTIIDPTYSGSINNKKIINKYFEDVSINEIEVDTIVMSHVFEHFYEPSKILEKFKNRDTIQNIYLNFPDLESYIKEGNYHVLNPEHIYYACNNYIILIFEKYGFELIKKYFHENHSVFFHFKRITNNINRDFNKIVSSDNYVEKFFNSIHERINNITEIVNKYPEYKVYIWPCSMHTTYILSLGLETNIKLESILDNATHKIGKYLYGYNYKCESFSDVINKNDKSIIIMNGGCYNKEIKMNKTNIIFI